MKICLAVPLAVSSSNNSGIKSTAAIYKKFPAAIGMINFNKISSSPANKINTVPIITPIIAVKADKRLKNNAFDGDRPPWTNKPKSPNSCANSWINIPNETINPNWQFV